MKTNTIWVLISGLAVGVLIGRELPRGGGDRAAEKAAEGTPTAAAPAGTPTELPASWIKAEEIGAADAVAGLTPQQKYLVMKVMNEKPCDCGCPHGSVAKCKKDDPGCPRAPQILAGAVEAAKAGKTFDQMMDAVKKKDAPAAQQQAPAGPQKVATEKWNPIRGPKNAKVTIVMFSDFQCPFCSRVEPTLKQVIDTYGKDVRIVWRNQPLPFHNFAKDAATAAMAAARQGKFWELHDKMFANQQAIDKASIEKYAQELGLNMSKFKADWASSEIKDEVEKDSQYGNTVGANGTPTMFINGLLISGAQPFDNFKTAVDAGIKQADELLKKGTSMDQLYEAEMNHLPAAPAAAAPSAPPPSEHVDVKIGDAPTKGPKNAPVQMVIFSDFQCPFCSRVEPTLKQIEDDYKGKIVFAWRNKPLPFHDKAHLAAEAAMAANEQGKFWEYHDALFQHQDQLDRPGLELRAQELHLDMAKFKAALDTGKFKARVDAEAAEGDKIGAGGTPTFFINGNKFVGAQPVAAFKQQIDAALAAKK